MARYILDIPDKTIAHIRADYGHGVKWINEEDTKILVELIYNAKPIVNGEWEYIHETFSKRRCKRCKYTEVIVDGMADKWCPNCGARMKESEDKE